MVSGTARFCVVGIGLISMAAVFAGLASVEKSSNDNKILLDNYSDTFFSANSSSLPTSVRKAVYDVTLDGISVGVATAGLLVDQPSQKPTFEIRFTHRLGLSQAFSYLLTSGGLLSDDISAIFASQSTGASALLQKATGNWKYQNQSYLFEEKSIHSADFLSFLLGNSKEIALQKPRWTDETHLFYYLKKEAASKASKKLFVPFTGELISSADADARFDPDGFLAEARIPLIKDLNFHLVRRKPDSGLEFVRSKSLKRIELGLLSTSKSLGKDLVDLEVEAEGCLTFALEAEKMLNRRLPEVSYLFHRKILDASNLCSLLKGRVAEAKPLIGSQPEKVLLKVLVPLRKSLAEDRKELPSNLASSLDWDVIFQDEGKWQAVRLLRRMVRDLKSELEKSLSVEERLKVATVLQMNVAKLSPRSVMKATLRAKEIQWSIALDVSKDKEMLGTSWTLPPDLKKPMRVANSKGETPVQIGNDKSKDPVFAPLNGLAYAKGTFASLEEICTNYLGQVSLDLGDSPSNFFDSKVVRGSWDAPTKLRVAEHFLRHAAASRFCRKIVIRVPSSMEIELKNSLKVFEKEVLQTENAFQISNGRVKKLRVVPGTYDLIVGSIVTGAVLGRTEIQVSEKGGIIDIKMP
jgi:hypothetical protein